MSERVSDYAARQVSSVHTLDFLRCAFATAKHPMQPSGYVDAIGMTQTLKSFRSVRIDGWMQRSAVAGGSAHAPAWGADWTDFHELSSEWALKTSALSFLGRLPYRRVPFQTRMHHTTADDVTFVGNGKAIPVQAATLSETSTLNRTTVATIAVVTNELVALWRPGTREVLDAILTRSVVRGLDRAALDPYEAAVAGERPASLLYGVAPIAALGATPSAVLGQVKQMLQALVDGGSDLESAVFVMHPREALTLSTMITTEGVRAFPELGAMGGRILGIPAVTSVGAVCSGSPSNQHVFAVVDGAQIAVADNGEIDITASSMATLQMDSAPTQDSVAGTGSTSVSMFQTDSTAIKLVRTINWERIADNAVAWLTAVA